MLTLNSGAHLLQGVIFNEVIRERCGIKVDVVTKIEKSMLAEDE